MSGLIGSTIQARWRPVAMTGALFGALLGAVGPLHAQLYRWVDDDGNVQYSDRLPPGAVDRGRTELSSDGLPVRTVEPPKSPEELLREQELERLRQEQAALIEQQRAADRALLRTYRSVDDLIMMRDGKLAAVDVMIQSTKGNIRRQQNRINRLQADAANLERVGKPVPSALERDMAASNEGVREDLAAILRYEHAKQEIYDQFASELERFRRLKDIKITDQDAIQESGRISLNNLVTCPNDRECDRLWGLAVGYVETRATLPIESSSETVAITSAPVTDADISLIVSRIADDRGEGASIFLDLQCRSYTASVSSCRTPERLSVLEGFRAALAPGEVDRPTPVNAAESASQSPRR